MPHFNVNTEGTAVTRGTNVSMARHLVLLRPTFNAVSIAICLIAAACTSRAGQNQSASIVETHRFTPREGMIILDVKIGASENMPFLLDTGASPCVLDKTVADRMGIKAARVTERRGGGGIFKSRLTDDPITLQIGANRLGCTETIVVDLSGSADLMGVRPAGIIGGDFFRGRVVEIDYDRSMVSVHRRHNYTRRAEGAVIPIRVEKNRPYLQARLSVQDGPQDVTRELLIDSGSFDHIDDFILKESKTPTRSLSGPVGLGSGANLSSGVFNRVEIGPYTFNAVPGIVPSVPIVGNGILTRFSLVFDYDGGWLWLRPRKQSG